MDELKTLLPGEVYTLSTGEQVIVKPVPFGKLRLFSEAVASLFKKLNETGLKLENIEDWKVIFDVAFEETLKIMSLVLEKPREWFDNISLSDGFGILTIVIEQNFTEDAKKNLKNLVEKVTSLLQMQSRPLSAKDIAGAKSKDTPQSKSDSSPEASSSSET